MASLRSAFPVTGRLAYLNAGSDGPVPAAARDAARRALDVQTDEGRHGPHFEAQTAARTALRCAYAELIGAEPDHVAVTTSTSEGLGKVLLGLGLGEGDEVLTSDQEHPGLLAPLRAAAGRGVRVRTAPLSSIASAVTAGTTLVACSHVGWMSGEEADPALRDLQVPVVLDGAQGAGAVPVDVRELGCAAYAASGQKWLCGADGTGFLHLDPGFARGVTAVAPGYVAHSDAAAGLLHDDARRHDTPTLAREQMEFSLAALEVLAGHGWTTVHRQGRELAGRLAEELAARGRRVAARGATTLVAWEDPDPPAAAARLAAAGVVVRHIPASSYVRASVGAWNDGTDVDRLLEAI